jgi:hypothetical protein
MWTAGAIVRSTRHSGTSRSTTPLPQADWSSIRRACPCQLGSCSTRHSTLPVALRGRPHELHGRRALVVCQPLACESDELRLVSREPLTKQHQGSRRLAPVLGRPRRTRRCRRCGISRQLKRLASGSGLRPSSPASAAGCAPGSQRLAGARRISTPTKRSPLSAAMPPVVSPPGHSHSLPSRADTARP